MPLHHPSPRFKEYQRAQKILLSTPTLSSDLCEVLQNRTSSRVFTKKITKEQLSGLLYWSLGLLEKGETKHRTYPSGGGFYPLEAYLAIDFVEGIDSGVYHYNVRENTLELLPFVNAAEIIEALKLENTNIESPSLALLLSFVEQRSHHKYGVFSNKLGLLEAGHVGQNLYLVAAALGFGICGLGLGEKVHSLNQQLRLDGENECVVYGFAIGG